MRLFLGLLSLLGGLSFALKLSSPSFENGGFIPKVYTCDGKNISPPLVWRDVPENTKSLVLIVHDPDAPMGDFTHWVVYSIPPHFRGLPQGVPRKPVVFGVVKQGINSFGYVGYGGPCPPPWDSAHRYIFELYTLDYVPNLPPEADRKTVEKALRGHVIANATLTGKYKRQTYFRFALPSPR